MASAHARKLKDYLNTLEPRPGTEGAGGLESMLSGPDAIESMTERKVLPDKHRKTAKRALEKVAADRDLDSDEQFVLEAIIIPDKRPAIDIVDGDFQIEHPLWTKFATDQTLHGNIRRAIPSVGRIELPNHPSLPYGGTGFVVGKNLLMTNRHVAEIFASGLGDRDIRFKAGLTAGIDFERERGDTASSIISIEKVVMIHPYWDMALLQVDGLSADHAPLLLSVAEPESLVDTEIAVIGYPAFDSRNDPAVQNKVFNGIFNIKRLQPGLVRPRASVNSFGKAVSALTHDSSTLGGNSGSEVFDPKSAKVLALHFAGVYLDKNYCVPAGELARDGRVVDAGVNFEPGAPGGTPEWQAWWRDIEPVSPIGPGPTPVVPSGGAPTPTPSSPNPGTPAATPEPGQWTVPVEITIRIGTATQVAVTSVSKE
jgi:endonuclease G